MAATGRAHADRCQRGDRFHPCRKKDREPHRRATVDAHVTVRQHLRVWERGYLTLVV